MYKNEGNYTIINPPIPFRLHNLCLPLIYSIFNIQRDKSRYFLNQHKTSNLSLLVGVNCEVVDVRYKYFLFPSLAKPIKVKLCFSAIVTAKSVAAEIVTNISTPQATVFAPFHNSLDWRLK